MLVLIGIQTLDCRLSPNQEAQGLAPIDSPLRRLCRTRAKEMEMVQRIDCSCSDRPMWQRYRMVFSGASHPAVIIANPQRGWQVYGPCRKVITHFEASNLDRVNCTPEQQGPYPTPMRRSLDQQSWSSSADHSLVGVNVLVGAQLIWTSLGCKGAVERMIAFRWLCSCTETGRQGIQVGCMVGSRDHA